MYRPVFTHQPESWQEWWQAVRAFTAGWYGMAPGEVTGNDPAVRALEHDIGTAISPSIHEWSAFTSDLQQAGLEHVIRDHPDVGWRRRGRFLLRRPDHSALRLLTLGEGDAEWVVMREHLADEDPPVDCLDVEEWDRRVLAARRHTATTSEFALQHLIAYLIHPAAASR